MRTWLKDLREDRQLTVQKMAEELEIGADHYAVIENGQLPLNIPVLMAVKLSELFDIPLSRLILYEQEYKESNEL